MGVISIGMLYLSEMNRGIAIEPDPRNFALLERNVAQNEFESRMICFPYAASDQASEVPFGSESNLGDHRVRIESDRLHEHREDRYGESDRRVVSVRLIDSMSSHESSCGLEQRHQADLDRCSRS